MLCVKLLESLGSAMDSEWRPMDKASSCGHRCMPSIWTCLPPSCPRLRIARADNGIDLMPLCSSHRWSCPHVQMSGSAWTVVRISQIRLAPLNWAHFGGSAHSGLWLGHFLRIPAGRKHFNYGRVIGTIVWAFLGPRGGALISA